MDGSVRGMPLLSGPPPPVEGTPAACRKDGKEFGFFHRAHQCNHCGYSYCSSCCGHHALMPRPGSDSSGYDPVEVCDYCIDNLTVTASGKDQLRALPVAKLRAYLKAYNIPSPGAVEKDDFVDAILNTRTPNGCLPPDKEDWYRRFSVPSGSRERTRSGVFNRTTPSGPSGPPPSAPQQRAAPSAPPRPTPNNRPQASPTTAPQQRRPVPSQPPRGGGPPPRPRSQAPPPARPNTNANAPPPRAASAAPTMPPRRNQQTFVPQPPPEAPIPSIESLLEATPDFIPSLSISILKAILFQNHVNARLLLTKEDLVEKVRGLVDAERREREREAEIHAIEELEIAELQAQMQEERRQKARKQEEIVRRAREEREALENRAANRNVEVTEAPAIVVEPPETSEAGPSTEQNTSVTPQDGSTISPAPASPNKARAASPSGEAKKPSALERSGLCVVCQDEDANVVTIDCGHLALCMHCSDLVMKTTRECPLCRTRIVTEQRLLRVFRT